MDVGVIGTGAMGRNHARIYSEFREIEKVYVYDPDKKVVRKLSEWLDVTVCDSMDLLLKKVDAASICVPTRYHLDVARAAINNDVNCLIEKPITSTSSEGEELLKIAKDHLVLGVGHIERFNPIVKEIKNLISDPKYIEIKRHNPGSSRIIDTDVVVDLMIHDIDLVWNHFFPSQSDFEFYSQGDSNLFVTLAKLNGCLVSLSASRLACNKIRTIHVEEEEFTVDGDFMAQEVYIHRKPDSYSENNTRYTQENIIEKVMINRVEPLKEELKTFLSCVRCGQEFSVTPEQAVLNLRIAENRGHNFLSRESLANARLASTGRGLAY